MNISKEKTDVILATYTNKYGKSYVIHKTVEELLELAVELQKYANEEEKRRLSKEVGFQKGVEKRLQKIQQEMADVGLRFRQVDLLLQVNWKYHANKKLKKWASKLGIKI